MAYDDILQVAPDNTAGKAVDMERVSTAAGSPIYRQRAVLVGQTGDLLVELVATNYAILTVLRALLGTIANSSGDPVSEDEVMNDTREDDT